MIKNFISIIYLFILFISDLIPVIFFFNKMLLIDFNSTLYIFIQHLNRNCYLDLNIYIFVCLFNYIYIYNEFE